MRTVVRVPVVLAPARRVTAPCRVRPPAVARAVPAPVVRVPDLARAVRVPGPVRVVPVPAGRVPTR